MLRFLFLFCKFCLARSWRSLLPAIYGHWAFRAIVLTIGADVYYLFAIGFLFVLLLLLKVGKVGHSGILLSLYSNDQLISILLLLRSMNQILYLLRSNDRHCDSSYSLQNQNQRQSFYRYALVGYVLIPAILTKYNDYRKMHKFFFSKLKTSNRMAFMISHCGGHRRSQIREWISRSRTWNLAQSFFLYHLSLTCFIQMMGKNDIYSNLLFFFKIECPY